MKRYAIVPSTLLILMMLAAALPSCSKKDSNKPRSELIVGNWQTVAATINPPYDIDGNGTKDGDLFAMAKACERDNIISIKQGGLYEENEGSTKCNATDNQIIDTGTWSLSNNDSNFIYDGETYSILQLDNETLVISKAFSINNVTYTITETFKRK